MYCISDNNSIIDESISPNVSIIQNGSNVIVDSVRDEGNVSFVVVYKAHGNSTLNVVQNETLPLIIPLNQIEPMNYTFAVFKMINHQDIDEKSVVTKMIEVLADIPSKPVLPTVKMIYTIKELFPEPSYSPTTGMLLAVSLIVHDQPCPYPPVLVCVYYVYGSFALLLPIRA